MYQHLWEAHTPEGDFLVCGTCGLRHAAADHGHTPAEEIGYEAIGRALHALLMTLGDTDSVLSDLSRTRARAVATGLLGEWSRLRTASGHPASGEEYLDRYRSAFPDDAEGIGRLEAFTGLTDGLA